MIRHILWTSLAVLCGGLAVFGLSLGGSWLWAQVTTGGMAVYQAPDPLLVLPVKPAPAELTLTFVGDLMLDRGVEMKVKQRGGDYHWLFTEVGKLAASDLLFGNLEGPLSDQGQELGNLYSFRMSPDALPALVTAGFDVLSIANNHMGDWGRAAFVDTVNRLSAAGIMAVGGGLTEAGATTVQIVERQGTTLGFLAFTDVGPDWLAATSEQAGIVLAKHPDFAQLITAAAAQVDVLVVSFHFGDEYQPLPNARQRLLAQGAIEAGAKIVVGHHPHVAQPVERYKDGVIAYSLGNFIFDQDFSVETMRGTVLHVKLLGKEITDVFTETSIITKDYQPQL